MRATCIDSQTNMSRISITHTRFKALASAPQTHQTMLLVKSWKAHRMSLGIRYSGTFTMTIDGTADRFHACEDGAQR